MTSAPAKELMQGADSTFKCLLLLKVLLQALAVGGGLFLHTSQMQNALYFPETWRAFFRACLAGQEA